MEDCRTKFCGQFYSNPSNEETSKADRISIVPAPDRTRNRKSPWLVLLFQPVLFPLDNLANMNQPGLPRLTRVLEELPELVLIGHGKGYWASIAGGLQQVDLQVDYPRGTDWQLRRRQIVAGLEKVMGPLPQPATPVPLDVEVLQEHHVDDLVRRKLTYHTDRVDRRAMAWLLTPAETQSPRPAMLCLHQTTATYPANKTPKHATNAHISFAALNQLVTQVSWVKLRDGEKVTAAQADSAVPAK